MTILGVFIFFVLFIIVIWITGTANDELQNQIDELHKEIIHQAVELDKLKKENYEKSHDKNKR